VVERSVDEEGEIDFGDMAEIYGLHKRDVVVLYMSNGVLFTHSKDDEPSFGMATRWLYFSLTKSILTICILWLTTG
jgi:hypothetical protein